jgi:DNA-binding response OmpR family regulator
MRTKTKAKIIYMCDDDPDLLEAVSSFLRDYGYRVETAGNHIELREKLQKNIPDLFILDIRLPERDGLWIAEGLHTWGIKAPIIFLTGYDKWINRFYEPFIGAFQYLVKPVPLQMLLEKIRQALSEQPASNFCSRTYALAGAVA